MITDTAVYRNPHYHKPTDTPDKLNYDHLARVVIGLEGVLRDVARAEVPEDPNVHDDRTAWEGRPP